MKWIKYICITIISLPFILIIFFVLYEIFGMYVNHYATHRQTRRLQANLEKEIEDIKIIDVYSYTGNISGTGNHVECLSVITFSTSVDENKINEIMSKHYNFGNQNCSLERTAEGIYSFRQETSAPFPDNIEGH